MASSSISTSDLPRSTTISSTLSNNDTSPVTVVRTRAQTHVRGTQTSDEEEEDDDDDDEKPTTTIANLMFLELQEAAHRNHSRIPRDEFAAWVPLLNKGFGGPAGGKVWVADITRDRYLYAGLRNVGRPERAAREKEGMRRFVDCNGEWRGNCAVVERKEYRTSRFSEVCFDVEGGCWRKLSEERVEVERNGGCTGEREEKGKGKDGKREWRKRIGRRVRGWWKRG